MLNPVLDSERSIGNRWSPGRIVPKRLLLPKSSDKGKIFMNIQRSAQYIIVHNTEWQQQQVT